MQQKSNRWFWPVGPHQCSPPVGAGAPFIPLTRPTCDATMRQDDQRRRASRVDGHAGPPRVRRAHCHARDENERLPLAVTARLPTAQGAQRRLDLPLRRWSGGPRARSVRAASGRRVGAATGLAPLPFKRADARALTGPSGQGASGRPSADTWKVTGVCGGCGRSGARGVARVFCGRRLGR